MLCTDTLIVRNQQASSDERAVLTMTAKMIVARALLCRVIQQPPSSICWPKELFAVNLGMLIIDVLFYCASRWKP